MKEMQLVAARLAAAADRMRDDPLARRRFMLALASALDEFEERVAPPFPTAGVADAFEGVAEGLAAAAEHAAHVAAHARVIALPRRRPATRS